MPPGQPPRLMRRCRYRLEYAGVHAGLALADSLPLSMLRPLAGGLASLWFALDRRRRRTACENLLRSGLATDARGARAIARNSFRHFGVMIVEALAAHRMLQASTWRRHVELALDPETEALLRDPKQGIILATGHLGNWEIAAQALSFIKPVVGITRNLNNPHTDRLMQERKPRDRFRIVPRHGAAPGRLLSFLSEGCVLALMVDLHAKNEGVMVDFLGQPASTYPTPALLHLVSRIPICFGCCIRTGPMAFRLEAPPPIRFRRTGDKNGDIRTVLSRIHTNLETAIRRHPEQYLWAHRRWRTPFRA